MNKLSLTKSIAFATLIIFECQISFSQENYLSGKLITIKGDTLNGFIDYRNWNKTPDKIFFKENLNENKIILTPLDIRGFTVLDEIYESAIIKTDVSPTNLVSNTELLIGTDTTFLQAIVRGSKFLYFYRNGFGNEQFYIKNDTEYELLVYKKYFINQNGISSITENRKFLGQLTNYLIDCLSIQHILENTKYTKESLEKLFTYYYDCTGGKITFQKKTEKISLEVGALAGLSLTSLKFGSDVLTYLEKGNFDQSVNFTTGLFFDIVFPRNQKKWSLNSELLITSYKVNGSYIEYFNKDYYTITTTTIGYSYMKINNMLRFKYPIGDFFVYFNVGLSNGLAITETNYKLIEAKFYADSSLNGDRAINLTSGWEQGYIFGLGAKYKEFSLEFRYDTGNGMSVYQDLSSNTKRISFLLGYRF